MLTTLNTKVHLILLSITTFTFTLVATIMFLIVYIYFDTVPEALERPYNVLPKEALKDSLHTPATVTKRESYQELQSRIKRVKKIKVVEAQLQASKQKMVG